MATIAKIPCFPLDNVEYEAKNLGAWTGTRTRGVFSAEGNLAVSVSSGMSIIVSPGIAWLKMDEFWGTVNRVDDATTLTLADGDAELNRVDAVVMRINKNANEAELLIKQGAYALTPVVAPPERNADYEEIYLATVSVPKGTIELTPDLITDQRLNETYCGLMRDGVTGIPTAQLQAQAEALIQLLEDAIAGVIDGSQYMLKAGYDQDNIVSEAGGIVPYVDSQLANMATKAELQELGDWLIATDVRPTSAWQSTSRGFEIRWNKHINLMIITGAANYGSSGTTKIPYNTNVFLLPDGFPKPSEEVRVSAGIILGTSGTDQQKIPFTGRISTLGYFTTGDNTHHNMTMDWTGHTGDWVQPQE